MAEDEQEYYGYYYGEEDKGLLDSAWEKQQRKVREIKCNYGYVRTVTLHINMGGVTELESLW